MDSAAIKDSKPLSPMQSPVPPEIRDKYKVTRILGKGAGGVVYKAKVRATGQIVAIKAIEHRSKGDSFEVAFYKTKQVLREIAILRHLSKLPGASEFIPRLIDAIQVTSPSDEPSQVTTFVVMDFVKGITLKEFMAEKAAEAPLSFEQLRKILFNFFQALAFLHEAGVIHRDIKPANLMLTADSELKIIDFGLARTFEARPTEHYEEVIPRTKEDRKTISAALAGSKTERAKRKRGLSQHVYARIYRSPEVALLEPYSFSADLWSAGCILAELLQCQEQYCHKPKHMRYVFKATSCYPLSPAPGLSSKDKTEALVEESDLTRVIIGILGDQKRSDLSFITSNSVNEFLKSKCFTGSGRIQFDLEFDKTPADLLEVLESCLQYNPYFRLPARELLDMKAFASYRAASQIALGNQSQTLEVPSPTRRGSRGRSGSPVRKRSSSSTKQIPSQKLHLEIDRSDSKYNFDDASNEAGFAMKCSELLSLVASEVAYCTEQ